jgi:uncharacterized membrane protein YdjX (TVP38/TMEM64 family)
MSGAQVSGAQASVAQGTGAQEARANESRARVSRSADSHPAFGRLVPLGMILAIMVVVLAMGWHRQLSMETFVRHRAAIEAWVIANHALAILAFMAAYAAAVALSFPGAALLTIGGGMLFGTLIGGLAAVAAATLGATAIFLLAKYAFGGVTGCRWARRAGPFGEKLAAGFRKDAFCYLVFLRLVPLFPFWLVNLVPAPAGVGLVPFVAATALGIVPATFAFAFFGAGLDSAIAAQENVYRACLAAQQAGCRFDFDFRTAATPELIGGLVALGLIALISPAVKWYRSSRAACSGVADAGLS